MITEHSTYCMLGLSINNPFAPMISWDLHISFAREADLVPTLQMMRLRQKGSELSILKPGRGSSGFEPRAWANSGAGSLGFRGQRSGFIAPFGFFAMRLFPGKCLSLLVCNMRVVLMSAGDVRTFQESPVSMMTLYGQAWLLLLVVLR